MIDDDDVPRLSAETFRALQEFLQEQSNQQEENNVRENWQLSQFWYDEPTTLTLSNAVLSLCSDYSKIALVSCPTLYSTIKAKIAIDNKNISVILFEYDKRFSKHQADFVFYNYKNPLEVKEELNNCFDVVVVDPPFLSEECLTKVAHTIKHIQKPDGKVILCTGAVMEDLAEKLLNVQKCSFQPKHKNNLANEFICLTNFGELPKDDTQ